MYVSALRKAGHLRKLTKTQSHTERPQLTCMLEPGTFFPCEARALIHVLLLTKPFLKKYSWLAYKYVTVRKQRYTDLKI